MQGSRFTEEELAIAKSVDLTAVASSLGFTVKRVGRCHTLKEMDSVRIYNRSHWFRWSRQYEKGNNGGSQIDFLRVFAGMEVKEAVIFFDFLISRILFPTEICVSDFIFCSFIYNLSNS